VAIIPKILKIRYLIQKSDYFIDEFKEIGFVDLEQAINSFKEFPFEEELIETKRKEIANRFSKIIFQSDNSKKVTIWIENNEGFFFCYENGKQFSQFFISNNFVENKEGLTVEYFLNIFFSGNIEEKLNLKNIKPIQKIEKRVITFSFNDSTKIYTLYNSIPWFIGSIIFLIYDYQNKSGMMIYAHLILSLFWLPSLYLFLSYWRINKNATVKIDTFENVLSYQKDGKRTTFNRNEIDKCLINEEESTSSRSNTKKFSYLHIILLNKEEIIITNFITEPHNIVNLLNLNYKVNDRYMATLPF
jgi:hypothetical protein